MSTTTLAPAAGSALTIGNPAATGMSYGIGVRAAALATFSATLIFSLHPAHATAALTGDTPGVQNGKAYSIPSGSLHLTGQTPSLSLQPTQIHPAAGALTFSPQTPGVTYGIKPAAGSLASSAAHPSLLLTLRPAAGSAAFSADSPTLSRGPFLSPAVCVALTRTGQPTLFRGVSVSPAAASASFGSDSPTLSKGPLLFPAVCVALLRGGLPTLFRGVNAAPAAGALSLTGNSPTLSRGPLLFPAACVALLRPGLPTLFRGVSVSPAAGALTLAGQSPTRTLNRVVAPFRAALLITPGFPALNPIAGTLASLLLRDAPLGGGNLAPYNYHSGQTAVLSIVFLDAKGVPLDPATVSLAVAPPYTAPPAMSVVKDSVGHYHSDLSVPSPGIWKYQWSWTGAPGIGGGNSFVIVN